MLSAFQLADLKRSIKTNKFRYEFISFEKIVQLNGKSDETRVVTLHVTSSRIVESKQMLLTTGTHVNL